MASKKSLIPLLLLVALPVAALVLVFFLPASTNGVVGKSKHKDSSPPSTMTEETRIPLPQHKMRMMRDLGLVDSAGRLKWVSEEECESGKGALCLVYRTDNTPFQISKPIDADPRDWTVCFKPSTWSAEARVELVNGGWTEFQHYRDIPRELARALEVRDPNARGHNPTFFRVIQLPQAILSNCNGGSDPFVAALWESAG